MGRRLLSEPALADPGLTSEREQAAAASDCAVNSGTDFGHFPSPPDKDVSAANEVQVAHLRMIQASGTKDRILTNFKPRRYSNRFARVRQTIEALNARF
jgi:hypothetical protein